MTSTAEPRATRIERALRIRAGERALVGWLVTLFTVIQASHGLGANAADALFFQRFGVDQLPLMILISGPAVALSVLGHGSGLAYRGAHRWLIDVTLICAAWAGGLWVGALLDHRAVYPVIWISTQMIMMVSLTVMWNAAAGSCTTRQAKRLFPIFATAGVAGGVIGNLLTGPLANLVGTPNLLMAQAMLLVGGSIVLVRARRFFDGGDDGDGGDPDSVLAGLTGIWAKVRSSRFLRLSAWLAVAMFCLFYLVYFPFSQSVANSFATEAETAGFLGIFSSIATGATFLFSLLVTNRLFSRLGLVVTLMIVPLVYAGGFATWLVDFNLASAAVVRGVQWVTVNAIALTAYTALFNVVTRRERGQVAAFMTAVPAQVGVSLAGAVLMVTTGARIETVFITGFGISVVTVGLMAVLRREYLDAVVSAVRRGVIGLFDTPTRTVFTPSDADSIRVLKEHLSDPRPGARALAVAGLGRLGSDEDADDLEPLLTDSDPRVRSAAFQSVCSIEPERVSSHAATAIRDEAPDVRLEVVHFLAAHPEDDGGVEVARVGLDDPDVRVRAAAAVVVGGDEGERVISDLLAKGEPRGLVAALTETAKEGSAIDLDPTPYLVHSSPLVRAAAATVSTGEDTAPSALQPLLDDPSSRVRRAAASALAETPAGRTVLIDVLETGSVTASESALRALTPLDELSDDFAEWARREAERAALLTRYAAAVRVPDPGLALRSLLSVLESRSRRLVQWVLLAMTTRETRGVMSLVARGVESSDAETRSQAIEALETLGARRILEVLLPLLEPDGTVDTMTSDEALDRLVDDFDPWLSALAARAIDESRHDGDRLVPSSPVMGDSESPSVLNTMDRVLVLQGVRMFADLDPEDLELIAGATTEETYEPGALILSAGSHGEEMLVIVDGSVVVSVTQGSERRTVRTYGPGDHVGELSLLAGGPRSADVHAGDEGARALALSTTDLHTVLEERPKVAMGMLGTLARRLIEQT